MAWISIHESIVGPKLRELRKKLKCSQWEAEGMLCSLWLWGLTNANKDGLLPFTGREDIAVALSGTSAGSSIRPDQAVVALIETGWLDENDDGLSIHDWDIWQEQWYKAKAKREYDAKRKRDSRKKSDAEADAPEVSDKSPDSPPDSPPTECSAEQAEQKAGSKYNKDFEDFWKVYPRKDEKAGAYKCYCARLKDGFSEAELLEAAKGYAAKCVREKTERKYTKLARTFLGPSTPFTDFIPNKMTRDERSEQIQGNPFQGYGV